MENEDDWRAKRAAELVGTPFERPIRPVRDQMDETLPMQRREPAVFAAAGSTAPAPTTVLPDSFSATSNVKKWSIAAAGVLAVLVAIIVSTLGRNRHDPTGVTASQSVAPVITPRHTATASIATPVTISARVGATRVASPATDTVAVLARRPTPDHGRPPASRPSLIVARAQAKPVTASPKPRKEGARRSSTALPMITISVPRCRPSSSRTDLAICASPTLTALDRQTRDLSALIVADGDQRLIDKVQRGDASFLKKRDHCKDEACLNKVYTRRIATLQKLRKKEVVAQTKAEERSLPVCAKGQQPAVEVCRRRPLLRRIFG